MLFNELNLIEPILRALQDEGYEKPTPIQEQAIPIVLHGNDLLGCAQTGTGKTAAFSIPILQLLHLQKWDARGPRPIRCLILTPTRELAIQIGESIQAYGRHLPLQHAVIFGGVGQKPQTDALRRGVDILVATPGRLIDLMNQGFVNLKSLSIFVLDEADRMLDMGFVHDVRRILARIPEQRQSLFFSATMPPEIQKLASTILKNPLKVEVAPVSSTADTIQQEVYFVSKDNKRKLLDKMLKQRMGSESVLVFTRTKHGADRVVKDLVKLGHTAEAIHGNKAQNARQRALVNFKSGKTRVLVATDIAARGIDIDNLAYVLNFDLPNVPETYVHRIGRTGRAGQNGTSFSFCMEEEIPYLRDIQKLIRKSIPVSEVDTLTFATPELDRGKKPTDNAQGDKSNKTAKSHYNRHRRNSHRNRNPQRGVENKYL
jgi:ATP-dependent RNA helicase RhlE